MTSDLGSLPRAVPSGEAAVPRSPADIRAAARAVLTGPEAGQAWLRYRGGASGEPDPRALYALLGSRRLLAPAWPVAYGGLGLTPHHQAAVVETLIDLGVAETLHTLSVQIAGTFILAAGDRAQRATLLPDLAAGRSFCTILYSEPEVGSDLAALTAGATRDPSGGWRISGRKVYSVKTRYADLALVAARTSTEASRYQGITLFCVPLRVPGVTIRGLSSIADEQFADVTLDDVRVGEATVIGGVGEAWALITDALALERTGVDYYAKAARWLSLWREHAAASGGPDPGEAVDVARLSADIEAARLFADRCLTQLAAGRVDPVLAATTKLWAADTARDVARWCAQESGPDAVVRSPDPAGLPGRGRIEAAYREAPGLTISAGTAEMMLEVVAGSGLPLPGGDLAGLDEEPLARALRAAVRDLAVSYDERDETSHWWAELARMEVFGLAAPVPDGGLDLGLAASAIVCEEMGRGLLDGGLLDTLTAVDAFVADGGPEAAGRLAATLAGAYRAALADRRDPARRYLLTGLDSAAELLVIADRPAVALCPLPPSARVESCADWSLWTPTAAARPGVELAADAAWLLERDRIRRAAWLVGLATGVLAETVRRVRARRQFGRTLIEHQAVAFTLARVVARTSAVRLLVTAGAAGDGDRCRHSGARALAAACDLAYAATREAMQLCGAWGMTDQSPAQRFYRAAMVACGLLGPPRRLWREVANDSTEGAEHGS